MDIKKIIAINLRRIRSLRDLTQDELAEKCELSKSMIGRIESCTVSASLNTLEIICIVLDIRPFELFIENEDIKKIQSHDTKKLKEDIKDFLNGYGIGDLP
ncbi:MAG: helix-turn-helix transcriptional regulator [Spirochaetaceae bacterium]|nr:helix-turn-helix transcriptional regulator [Spirochaetaceae bacterium]